MEMPLRHGAGVNKYDYAVSEGDAILSHTLSPSELSISTADTD